MSQNARSLKSDDKMTISTKLYPPLEHVDQPLPNNVILLDSNDNIFNYDRDGLTSSWSMHSNWSSIQQDDGRASSLDSWGEDEFDRQAARRVLDMFAEIDLALYEGKRLDIPLIDAECTDWRAMFPHFRLTGRRIRPQSRSTTPHRPPSVTVASTRNRKKKKKRKLRSSLPSTSKQAEEIFAQHGTLEDGEDGAQSPSKLKSARSQESENFRAAVVQELTARHIWSDVMTCISPLIDSYRPEIPETNRSSPAVKRHSVPPHAIEKLSGQSRRSTQANVVTFLAEYQSPVPRRVQSLGAPKQRTVRQPIPSNSRMISAVKLQPRKLRPIRTTASDPSAYPTAAARKQTTSKGWSRLPPIDSSRSPRVQLSVAPRPT
uniref:DUF3719 domain-containing protein n=1 Tax=Plectus sambesii TaxID=2011161 RepID=A0A914XM79_9BILA